MEMMTAPQRVLPACIHTQQEGMLVNHHVQVSVVDKQYFRLKYLHSNGALNGGSHIDVTNCTTFTIMNVTHIM